jgi:hypothetical protein
MNWFDFHELTKWAPLPGGYRLIFPTREDFELFAAFVRLWFPDANVGVTSCPMWVFDTVRSVCEALYAKWLGRNA